MMQNTRKSLILAILTGFLFASLINIIPADIYAKCGIPDKTDPNICHDEFFGGNDIIFYDPNAVDCEVTSTSNGGGPLIGNDNAEKIFKYLIGRGLSAAQAAGFLGNMQQESGFDPAIRQGGAIAPANFTPVHDEGFGIVQWTHGGTTPGSRQGDLYALSRSTGRNIIDLSLQLDYVWQELNGGWKVTLDRLQGVDDPVQAAIIVHDNYEISDDTPAEVRDVRGGNARTFFDKYKSLAPSTPSATPANSTGCQPATPGIGLTEFMSESFVIYNQCNTPPYGGPWGDDLTTYKHTMCSSACSPTALAMIAKNMTGSNVSPVETIAHFTANNYWYPSGGSLIRGLAESAGAFGLNVEAITNKGDVNAYKEVFAKGGLISVSSRGTSPFLPQGHTIVLRGITAEGKFMIADPGYRETNIAPANQISVDKILTDVRSDGGSVSNAYYKK
ncbi:MAG TPA: phage tail tip lysozyme [Candidatus Saccharimonadales bacterium]|jgi:hypothetical protein|nr:phage tail tip lysozyme [Candidatus Saccharimonadales bacterium]